MLSSCSISGLRMHKPSGIAVALQVLPYTVADFRTGVRSGRLVARDSRRPQNLCKKHHSGGFQLWEQKKVYSAKSEELRLVLESFDPHLSGPATSD
ncbi:hypothetical protein AVEN_177450-1 [Araneus ventricosus]|uniref:Uncharacterized protein n=1 Tax=Araneus ventricosus TaxID=182803 RepID=A0A4Y2QBQ3_ARAVE|nr:hypothetical protein AVEN_177450-1 [Araneus ventricosus]